MYNACMYPYYVQILIVAHTFLKFEASASTNIPLLDANWNRRNIAPPKLQDSESVNVRPLGPKVEDKSMLDHVVETGLFFTTPDHQVIVRLQEALRRWNLGLKSWNFELECSCV